MKEKKFNKMAEILHTSGIVGLDDYYSKRLERCYIVIIMLSVVAISTIMCDRDCDKRYEQLRKDVIEKSDRFQDSLVSVCNREYNVTDRVIALAKK